MFARNLFRLGILAATLLASTAVSAQVSDDVVKIGVLTDMNGPASTPTGQGSVTAAQMAIDDFGGKVAGLPADLLIAAVLVGVAAACLRAPVSRRVLVLLAIPVIPYTFLWQEKLAVDLFGQPGGGSAIVSSSIPLLYLPPLLLASLVLFGTWLARRRGDRDRQVGSATA